MMKKNKIKPTLNGKLLFPSEYLVAEDLADKEWTLTIARVTIEDRPTDQGPQAMPMLYFEELIAKGSKKKLGCNVTNARSIAELHGAEALDWVGKRITLYGTTCEAFGETVTCVRIKAPSRGRGHVAREAERDPAEATASEEQRMGRELAEENTRIAEQKAAGE